MLCRIQPRVWEETLMSEGEPVLVCRSRLPELSALEERVYRRINAFYIHAEERFQHWCAHRLFRTCDARRRSDRERSRPFEPWAPCLDFETVMEQDSDTLTVRLLLSGEGLSSVQRVQRWSLRDGLFEL